MNDQPQAGTAKRLTSEEFFEVVEAVYQRFLLSRPQAAALDAYEHRALVMVLRQLHRAWVRQQPAEDSELSDALTIAGFIWPQAFAEAVRDDDGNSD